jgi:hypothetical protein
MYFRTNIKDTFCLEQMLFRASVLNKCCLEQILFRTIIVLNKCHQCNFKFVISKNVSIDYGQLDEMSLDQ